MASRLELETGMTQYGQTSANPLGRMLNESTIADLTPKFRDALKKDIFELNRAWSVAGEAMKSCILFLDSIKTNYPKQFKSVCENELDFSDSIAYDLVKAAPWVKQHNIPNALLANVSARSLRIIATEKNAKIQAALTEMIISKEGMGIAESDIKKKKNEMKGKAGKSNKDVKETAERAKKELATDADAATVKAWYKKEFDNLEKKLNTREDTISELRKKNEGVREDNSKLRKEVADLKKEVPTTEDSKKLMKYIKANPQGVKLALGIFDTAAEKQEAMQAKAEETVAALKV